MEILLSDIPEDGLQLDGSFPSSIFELNKDDSIRPQGDVIYDTTIYRFEEVIVFSGRLRSKFQLQCARCLDYFDYDADFKWSSELDIEKRQFSFDLKDIVREDFLLELPSSPKCNEILEGKTCEKSGFIEQITASEKALLEDERDVWGALDDLGKSK